MWRGRPRPQGSTLTLVVMHPLGAAVEISKVKVAGRSARST